MSRPRRRSPRLSPEDTEPVTFSEPIELAACELRWDEGKGDPFALIEAVAICAGRKWDYPGWVRQRFDEAYTSIFLSVFPGVDLSKPLPGELGYSDARSTDEKAVAARFDRAVARATKILCLSIDRQHVLQSRELRIRDLHLARLVAELAKYKHTPRPRFVGVEQIMKRLARALKLTPDEWARKDARDAVLLGVKGIPVRIREVPPECRGATYSKIKRAWLADRPKLLAERTEQYEADHE
jgi:hypothetical protein